MAQGKEMVLCFLVFYFTARSCLWYLWPVWFAPPWPLINFGSFYRINRITHFHVRPALTHCTKSYATISCKHTSLHSTLNSLLQQPCCGLQLTWPTELCLPFSAFPLRLYTDEIHVRRGWYVIVVFVIVRFKSWRSELVPSRCRSKLKPVLKELCQLLSIC